MFTGIVQGTAEVVEITEKNAFRTHRVRLPASALGGLTPGASIAHNGCCLTVTRIDKYLIDFDLMQGDIAGNKLGGTCGW